MEIHKLDVEQTNLIFPFKILSAILVYDQKVNEGNDQEMAQSETNSHSKNRGGKTKLTIREGQQLYPKRRPRSYLNITNYM